MCLDCPQCLAFQIPLLGRSSALVSGNRGTFNLLLLCHKMSASSIDTSYRLAVIDHPAAARECRGAHKHRRATPANTQTPHAACRQVIGATIATQRERERERERERDLSVPSSPWQAALCRLWLPVAQRTSRAATPPRPVVCGDKRQRVEITHPLVEEDETQTHTLPPSLSLSITTHRHASTHTGMHAHTHRHARTHSTHNTNSETPHATLMNTRTSLLLRRPIASRSDSNSWFTRRSPHSNSSVADGSANNLQQTHTQAMCEYIHKQAHRQCVLQTHTDAHIGV